MKKVKLICIPPAGGTASAYWKWEPYLHPNIEMVCVELAGKGSRFSESLYKSVEEAVDDILSLIEEDILNCSYALFGHSMGAILAYELLCKLKDVGHTLPIYSFFSGKSPPHLGSSKRLHDLNDIDFWNAIKNIGGTPEEILINPDARKLFSPILRQDFKLVETYNPVFKKKLIDIPFVVMYGKEDKLTSFKTMEEWDIYCDSETHIHALTGEHFFIYDNIEEVVNIVNDYLLSNNI